MERAHSSQARMPDPKDVFAFSDNSPPTLFDLSMEYIVLNLDTITTVDPHTRHRKLRDDVILPKEICDRFLEAYQKVNRLNDNVANIFQDRSCTRLETVKINDSRISDESLRYLLEHKPIELELVKCDTISHESLDAINANSENLVSLKLGPIIYIFDQENENLFIRRGYVVNAPKLRSLTVHRRGHAIFSMFLRPLTQLTHLDLSESSAVSSVWALHQMKNLKSLVLYSVYWSKDIAEWISGLRSLVHLDISQANERHGKYYDPNTVLSTIVTSLPHLESLDISGTNLAGTGAAAVSTLPDDASADCMEVEVRCDIPGLVTRVNRPLEFLGLYVTHHGACKRHDIPAKIVSMSFSHIRYIREFGWLVIKVVFRVCLLSLYLRFL